MNDEIDHTMMSLALEEAKEAAARGEVPIGAVLVDQTSGQIVAKAGNCTRELNDPSAHAEMLVIRDRCKQVGAQRIPGHDLYVTLEPCTMCAGVIAFARINRLIIGAEDPKGGGVLHGAKFFDQPTCHHKIDIVRGIESGACGQILKDFFADKR